MIYLGNAGVVREVSQGYIGRAGVVRPLYDGYCGVDGVQRQFLGGKITADMIEKLELVPDSVWLYQIDSSGERTGDYEYTKIHSESELNAYPGYGSVTVDASSGSVTVVGNKTGYQLVLELYLYVVYKSGLRVTFPFNGKIDNPKFTTYFYVNISSSSGAHGMYMSWFCGVNVGPGSYSGSASRTLTGEPTSHFSEIGSGIARDSGTQTATFTIRDFTIGGKQFLPEITYN